MCLGVPGQIVEIAPGGESARVRFGDSGAVRDVRLDFLDGEPARIDEWVGVHLGFALERLTAEEARDALEALVIIGPGPELVEDLRQAG